MVLLEIGALRSVGASGDGDGNEDAKGRLGKKKIWLFQRAEMSTEFGLTKKRQACSADILHLRGTSSASQESHWPPTSLRGTLLSIIEQAGLSKESFVELLG
jgi:hypothetical protein